MWFSDGCKYDHIILTRPLLRDDALIFRNIFLVHYRWFKCFWSRRSFFNITFLDTTSWISSRFTRYLLPDDLTWPRQSSFALSFYFSFDNSFCFEFLLFLLTTPFALGFLFSGTFPLWSKDLLYHDQKIFFLDQNLLYLDQKNFFTLTGWISFLIQMFFTLIKYFLSWSVQVL